MLSTLLLAAATAAALFPVPGVSLDPEKAVAQYVLDSWSTEDGLPQNTIRAIWQSRDGYLWLATQDGLARFNGLEFKVYDDSDPAFASVRILSIGEDNSGRLWVGTRDGIVLVVDGVARALNHLPPRTQVSSFHPDDGDGMWVGTWASGLYHCTQASCTLDSEPDIGEIQSIVRGLEGLWIGTERGIFDLQGGALELVSGTATLSVSAMALDPEGRLVVAARDHRMIRVLPSHDVELLRPEDGWPAERIRSIALDGEGSLWMGLETDGIIRYSAGEAGQVGQRDDLPGIRVLSLFEDKEGSMWVGTEGGGLARFRNAAFTTIDTRAGLAEPYVTTLYQAETGRIWAGTFGGGINLIDHETLQVLGSVKGLPSANITGVAGNGRGTVWVGTIDAGVSEIRQGLISQVGPLPSESVYALHVDAQGDLWVGTDVGLAHLHNGTVTNLTTADGLGSNSIVSLEDNGSGTLWVGTDGGGLTEISQGGTRTWGLEDGLKSDVITALHFDTDGVLWIGTIEGGLSVLINNQIRSFSRVDGLYSNTTFQILEDDFGYLWMGSNKGISRVSKEAIHEYSAGILDQIPHEAFGIDDGLRSAEINGGTGPAGWKSQDGKLWFPTVKGVAVVDPADLSPNRIQPTVVIERVVADGVSIIEKTGLALAPGTRRIEFKFAALSLIDASAVQYLYRLENKETGWTSALSANTATYTFLEPGHYTFRVKASNNDGVWNEQGASLAFYLKPYLFQTRWFWILITSLGFVGAGLWIRARTKQLNRQRRRLETMVEDRTRDVMAAKDQIQAQSDALRGSLREKEVLLREVHHRVKNNLQMISSLLQLQARQVDDPETKVRFTECRDRIYSFSMVHERLYMAKDMAQFDFVDYIHGLTEQLVKSLDFGGDHIQLSVEVQAVEMNVDSAIQCGLIVTELITNSLRHAFDPGDPGAILVDFNFDGVHCVLSVEDDGRGLSSEFQTQTTEGLGLKLVDALVRRLRGTLESSSVLTGGTRFEIRFPLSESLTTLVSEFESEAL